MRARGKQVRHEEEEESAFVSMTDMTVGFLFIIMILLAFFASQIRDPDAVSKDEFDIAVAQRDAFERDRNEWKARADNYAVRIGELEELLEELEEELGRLNLRTVELETERDELSLSLSLARDRIADLKDQLAQLELQLAELGETDPLEAYLSRVYRTRRLVLTALRDAIRIDFPYLQVEISEESDALRFQGEGLFPSGRSDLTHEKAEIVSKLAKRLDEALPCFTLGPGSEFGSDCNPDFVLIEAVQIEGHTDDVGPDRVNRNLSAARANSTFFSMTEAAPGLTEHLNLKRQPVLSVAAYGPDRPVTSNDTAQGQATNRRIDLRFIMVTPRDTEGIEVIREALQPDRDRQ